MLKRFFLKETNILIAISINALVIFLWYFKDFSFRPALEWIDYGFIIFFLLEALVKINALGWKVYIRDNWNRFDFFLVLISLPSLLAQFMPIPDTSIFLILRLLRLIRLVKFIQFIPHLESIIKGLGRALKASVFVIIALFFLNFILAIFTCHIYGEKVPEFFGNPMIAAYSIFQLFTIEGWNEIPSTIATAYGAEERPLFVGASRFFIVMIVLVGGIFGMSLANAVFVDEMTMDNNDHLEKKIDTLQEQIAELKTLVERNAK